MRIICPNCDAQYEVPDSVIPKDGRDVECSNCGKTWFQFHPDHMPKPLTEAAPEPEPEPEEAAAPVPTPATQRRSLDPEVADILREEAARETAARSAEGLEVQTELNLPDTDSTPAPDPNPPSAPPPMAGAAGAAAVGAAAAVAGSRRELLPDIEEINSTLRSADDRDKPASTAKDPAIAPRKKTGFGRGFLLAVVVIVVAVMVYAFAPQLAEAMPQADPWLKGYVSAVDNGRLWLNDQVQTFLQWLDAQAAASDQS